MGIRPSVLSGIAAFSWILTLWTAPAEARKVDLELVLAVDVSGSVDIEEAKLQRQGYVSALVDPAVISAIEGGYQGAIAVTYLEWAGSHHKSVVAEWAVIEDEASARAFAAAIGEAPITSGLWTSISGAIEFAMPMFDQNGYEGSRRVIDISGDGANNDGRLVTLARDDAVAARVTINGLPIVNDRPNPFGWRQIPDLDLYYRNCVIGGMGAFIVVAEGFEDFAAAIRKKLIFEIAGTAPWNGQTVLRGQGRVFLGSPSALYTLATAPLSAAPSRHSDVGLQQAARTPPSCDIGERLLRQRRGYWGNDN